jgi:hypothetical protein
VKLSDEILTNTWAFDRGQAWQTELIGATVRQGASACITRNIAIPEVHTKGDKPFIFAARFPNGSVAIAAQERTQVGNARYMPACDVALSVSDAPGPFGVFGYFDRLTRNFAAPLKGKRILAQDLMGDKAGDISKEVRVRGTTLHIPGKVIRHVGLHNGTLGDVSAPGLVIAIV